MSAPVPVSNDAANAASASAATNAVAAASASAPHQQGTPFPSAAVLLQAAKLALAQDNPIRLDYYVETANGAAFMGEDAETKDKMLVKSAEEFTSLIQKTYKVGEDYIVLTENSIYVVSGKLQKRKIQANSLRND
jgi:hypothetical protein